MAARARSAALIAATVLMGISWSFALVRLKTGAYPYLWAAALPLLAFYFSSGPRPFQLSRHVPAATVALYALVLWHITQPMGLSGTLLTVTAGAAGAGALWFGAALRTQTLTLQPSRATSPGDGKLPRKSRQEKHSRSRPKTV